MDEAVHVFGDGCVSRGRFSGCYNSRVRIRLSAWVENLDVRIGSAWRRVRNISMGLMTVADNVRARLPAMSGAGVRLAVNVLVAVVVADEDGSVERDSNSMESPNDPGSVKEDVVAVVVVV